MTSSKPRLDGKVAIVTGAGTQSEVAGTGQATAVLLAREGAKVLLVDRSEENANKTLADIEEEGGTASVFTGDVTRSADCRAMTETAVNRYGGLHILFNNVGVSYPGTVVDVREEHWDEIMEVNIKAMMLASRYAIPAMVETGGGSIINVASIDGFRSGWSYNVAYETSKGGVIALTINMAVQHGRDGIRVNCIAPGHLHASFTAGLSDAHRELQATLHAAGHRRHGLGRGPRGRLPGQRGVPLDHGGHAPGRCGFLGGAAPVGTAQGRGWDPSGQWQCALLVK